jgi:hypothetical protein
MDDRQRMRASDRDREEVIARLRVGLDEGRLKMDEYLDRMSRASDAVTYGDLVPLYADLPQTAPATRDEPSPPAAVPRPAPVRRGAYASLPTALKVLWTIWLTAVSVNVVVWVLVCATTTSLVYPWPVWVAGPYGAVLLAVSAAVTKANRGRGSADGPAQPLHNPALPSAANHAMVVRSGKNFV